MILYSSNPNEVVCDFFLGGFSTAKVAKGLGRNACGFEINKQAFDYQIKELDKIKPGEYQAELRPVPENRLINKGKPLTQEEINAIVSEFTQLIRKGYTKKAACDRISEKYGRGYWSIQNILGNTDHILKSAATTLFD
jgi:site-specific DNA-methyltransferase (adenine-specific)